METRLGNGIDVVQTRLDVRELQQAREESFGLGGMMAIIAGARESAAQQCSSFAETVFNSRGVAFW